MSNVEEFREKIFDQIKHIDEFGNEYWEGRELASALKYTEWRNFKKAIERAKIACSVSKNKISDHFVDINKMVSIGSNASKKVNDYKLSRYACYLIVQNGDPRKKEIALGQTYFAIQTRKMELTEQEYARLSEDEKRLYTRLSVRNKNKYLFATAKASGVNDYGKFNDYGYKGLYNGETAKQIAKRKQIDPEKEDILDHMGSTELAANLFRITQTDEVLKNKKVNNEQDACITHNKVGKAVRNAIKEIGGTMPEDLPTPRKSIKELEFEEKLKIKE